MGSVMDNQERPWEARKRRGQLMRELRAAHDKASGVAQFASLKGLTSEDLWDLLVAMGNVFPPAECDGESVWHKD